MTKTAITKKCEFDGVEFTTFNSKHKYCSDSCKTKANNQRRENERTKAEEIRMQDKINENNRIAEVAKRIQISQIVSSLAIRRTEIDKELEDKRLLKEAEEIKLQKEEKEKKDKEVQDNANKVIFKALLIVGAVQVVDSVIKGFISNSKLPGIQNKPGGFPLPGCTIPPTISKPSGAVPDLASSTSYGYTPQPGYDLMYWSAPPTGLNTLSSSDAKAGSTTDQDDAPKIRRSW